MKFTLKIHNCQLLTVRIRNPQIGLSLPGFCILELAPPPLYQDQHLFKIPTTSITRILKAMAPGRRRSRSPVDRGRFDRPRGGYRRRTPPHFERRRSPGSYYGNGYGRGRGRGGPPRLFNNMARRYNGSPPRFRGGDGLRRPRAERAWNPRAGMPEPHERIHVSRELTCPFLLRMFLKENRSNEPEEFAAGRVPKQDAETVELNAYTWMDCTLAEMTDLVKSINPKARIDGCKMEYSTIFPNPSQPVMSRRILGQFIVGDRNRNHKDTLHSLEFRIGDYIAVAIIPPARELRIQRRFVEDDPREQRRLDIVY